MPCEGERSHPFTVFAGIPSPPLGSGLRRNDGRAGVRPTPKRREDWDPACAGTTERLGSGLRRNDGRGGQSMGEEWRFPWEGDMLTGACAELYLSDGEEYRDDDGDDD